MNDQTRNEKKTVKHALPINMYDKKATLKAALLKKLN